MKNFLNHWIGTNLNTQRSPNSKQLVIGGDKSGLCLYTYNEFGYRGDSFSKQGFKVMSIGCSHTEGIGLNDWETYSHVFCSLLENSVNINLGLGASSNDYIARSIINLFDLIKPDLVLIQYTYIHRREIYTENNEIFSYTPNKKWGYFETENGDEIHKCLTLIQNEKENLANWYKNHLLIKNFLQNKNCNWIWNGAFGVPSEFNDHNRFDGMIPFFDYGADNLHAGPNTNKDYSYKLYKFILKEFPNYIPKENIKFKIKNFI